MKPLLLILTLFSMLFAGEYFYGTNYPDSLHFYDMKFNDDDRQQVDVEYYFNNKVVVSKHEEPMKEREGW